MTPNPVIVYLRARIEALHQDRPITLSGYLARQTTIRELEQRILELECDSLTMALHDPYRGEDA